MTADVVSVDQTDLSKLRFIAKVVETTNAVLGIEVVMIHNETKSNHRHVSLLKWYAVK